MYLYRAQLDISLFLCQFDYNSAEDFSLFGRRLCFTCREWLLAMALPRIITVFVRFAFSICSLLLFSRISIELFVSELKSVAFHERDKRRERKRGWVGRAMVSIALQPSTAIIINTVVVHTKKIKSAKRKRTDKLK